MLAQECHLALADLNHALAARKIRLTLSPLPDVPATSQTRVLLCRTLQCLLDSGPPECAEIHLSGRESAPDAVIIFLDLAPPKFQELSLVLPEGLEETRRLAAAAGGSLRVENSGFRLSIELTAPTVEVERPWVASRNSRAAAA